MAITIDGAGTITGIASGGLNDNIITDDELNLAANASNVKTALNASGTAPIYACRAWVNFNGTGNVAIRASGNVTGITDNGTGDYTVNFTTAMPDANYSYCGNCNNDGDSVARHVLSASGADLNTTSIKFSTIFTGSGAPTDSGTTTLAIFR